MHEQPYRPCPACNGLVFDSLPEVGFETYAKASGNLFGVAIEGRTQAATTWCTMIICVGCGHTDMFIRNHDQLRKSIPNAFRFRARP
ncbi:MAG: hypothetical protein KIT72_04755 [Polyangiaceae bacterium]|nr:hypothetical protein [Polyangiaceae bacterium]MCW5789714.1 hypothetical protein [Polyangiaceae bacterium]